MLYDIVHSDEASILVQKALKAWVLTVLAGSFSMPTCVLASCYVATSSTRPFTNQPSQAVGYSASRQLCVECADIQ